MHNNKKNLFFLVFSILVLFSNLTFAKDFAVKHTVEGEYESLLEDFILAIEEQGMVISYRSHVAKMLERTKAVVANPNIPYLHAEVVGFCKSDISHKTLSENPHNIVFCPFSVAVYELKDKAGTVYFSYRLPPEFEKNSHLNLISKLLEELIEEIE